MRWPFWGPYPKHSTLIALRIIEIEATAKDAWRGFKRWLLG